MMLQRFLLLCLLSLVVGSSAFAENLTVLDSSPKDGSKGMLFEYLRPQVEEALQRRRTAFEERERPEEITAWQNRLREKFVESLGGFPERTPLNVRIVDQIQAEGYGIEKIIYESRPNFFVTAALYLPETEPPYPAVLLPCGHSENGKAAEPYQRASILLARNGMAVLCYDPVGQGERKQILERDEQGRLLPEGRFRSTSEHTMTGIPAILLGENLATYRIWDGMRGIDYLVSRDDIDGLRIGCTGNSGGGLMTSYLMALDERIQAAAPGCFITTTRRKNVSPGPGDAEQNIFAQTAYGLDHADYVMLAAPRSVLICSATRDFVPIQGAWESFRQAKRLYTRMGIPERVNLVEAERKHGFTKPLRESVAHWMQRWLLDADEPVDEPEFPIHSEEQLQCTPEGQVLLMDGARSLYDLYREKAGQLAEKRRQSKTSSEKQVAQIREVAGIRRLEQLPSPKEKQVGEVQREGYEIEKLVLEPEEGIRLPALLFRPEEPNGEAVLYVHGEGKGVDAGPGGRIEKLVRSGKTVLAVDLRGYGENETKPWRFNKKYAGPNAAEYFIGYMLGRSLVGMRAEDVLVSARYLQRKTDSSEKVQLIAVADAGIPALHAAVTARELFSSVHLQGSLDSWQRVVETPVTVDQLENTIHGVLKFYDLPDLIDLFGRDRVAVEKPRDATGQLLSSSSESDRPGSP